jgi:hypothetical protein
MTRQAQRPRRFGGQDGNIATVKYLPCILDEMLESVRIMSVRVQNPKDNSASLRDTVSAGSESGTCPISVHAGRRGAGCVESTECGRSPINFL